MFENEKSRSKNGLLLCFTCLICRSRSDVTRLMVTLSLSLFWFALSSDLHFPVQLSNCTIFFCHLFFLLCLLILICFTFFYLDLLFYISHMFCLFSLHLFHLFHFTVYTFFNSFVLFHLFTIVPPVTVRALTVSVMLCVCVSVFFVIIRSLSLP